MNHTKGYGIPSEKECEALLVLRDVIILISEEIERNIDSTPTYLTKLRDSVESLSMEALRLISVTE